MRRQLDGKRAEVLEFELVLERKSLELGSGSLNDDGILEGYASVKHEVDAYGDVILDGAYGDLEDFVRNGFVALGHDHSGLPIGFVESALEDVKGLVVKMRFHGTEKGQSALLVAKERMRAGRSVGLSIGYLPRLWRFEERNGRRIRLLEQIELKEFSSVTMPAARNALATDVRSERLDIDGLAPTWV